MALRAHSRPELARADEGDVVILDGLTILAATLFAGAAVYINLVEHPARLSCGTEIAARQWAPSYHRATFMQVPLAIGATIGGVVRWLQTGDILYVCGAVTILAVIPFTLLVIMPTNRKLLLPGRDLASRETRSLLERWGRLHAIRSALSITASIILIWAATH